MAMETKCVRNIIEGALILREDFGERLTRSPDHRSTSVGAVSLHFSESLVIICVGGSLSLSYTGMEHIAVRICSKDLRNSGSFYLHRFQISPVCFNYHNDINFLKLLTCFNMI